MTKPFFDIFKRLRNQIIENIVLTERPIFTPKLSRCCDGDMSGSQCITCGACGLCGGWCDGGKICEDYQNKHYKNA